MANTNYSTSSLLGAQLGSTHTSAKYAVGTVTKGLNNSEWVYVQASVSVAQYDVVWITKAGKATSLTAANARTPGFLGFAQVNFANDDYGWVMKSGKPTINAAASCQPNIQLFTTNTAGVIDDATLSTSQFQIIGLIASQSSTAGGVTAIVAVANNPTIRRIELA